MIFLVIMLLSTAPMFQPDVEEQAAKAQWFTEAEGYIQVADVVTSRCSMCHAAEPVWQGQLWLPKSVKLETEADIVAHARGIYLQDGLSHAMPQGNLTDISDEDRAAIRDWFAAATGS